MQLTTPVHIATAPFQITYSDVMVSMGSCFSDNIGRCLKDAFFSIEVNPWGILFNPASIAQAIHRALDGVLYDDADLVFSDGLWHSPAHHGSFSCPKAHDTLSRMNDTLRALYDYLHRTDLLILTFGTAWVYEREGRVVANCHKLPANQFLRRRMTVDEIVQQYTVLLKRLFEMRPHLKVVFTVSPIRHLKDGLHENQLSKASLLLAVEQICAAFPNATYFPAYEIVLDELRDYRFYEEDMTHPTPLVVSYIWEKFCATYMDASTRTLLEQAEQIRRKLNHRPLYPNSPQAEMFRKQAMMEAEAFQQKLNNL